MQVISKKYFTGSSSDHGSFSQLLTLIKRIPAANKPKKDMNACTVTVFKGHVLAFACQELGIENIDSNLDNPTLAYLSDAEKRKFIVGLSMRVVENCTIIGDAILESNVEESGDKKYDHPQTLCCSCSRVQ